MEKKVIALDLDGTTLNSNGVVPVDVRMALERTKKEGHIICFVTGRSESELLLLDECCLVDYLVVNNGGKVIRQWDEQVIAETYLPKEEVVDIIKFCEEQELLLFLTQGKVLYANQKNERIEYYACYIKQEIFDLNQLQSSRLKAVESMTIVDRGCVAKEYLTTRRDVLNAVMSEDGNIDIMNFEVNKWKGIQIVLKELGREAKQVVAIGDYDNDYEMVKNAGMGIAVANAKPELKEVADYVTENDHNHGAVAEALFRFVLESY